MAEVGQRLGSGAYRLSALINGQGRPVRTGDCPGCQLVSCNVSDSRLKEQPAHNQRQVQPVARTQRKSTKLSRLRPSNSQQDNASFWAASLDLDSSRFISESLQVHLHPLLQDKLLPGRMTTWIRGAVSIHPDTFRSPQQLRAFCTVILILSEQGSERQRKLHPGKASSRSYSWRSDSSSKDVPPLYRSRTYYYDILKVNPGATQSQIKTAYYKQCFIYHPDKNPESEEATRRFSEVSEAYTVLGNISLRRKYDRGLLSQSDLQSAAKPSSTSKSTGSPQQRPQYKAKRFTQTGEKTMFDFDAFYRAHYGDQLQRERDLRARKQRMQELQKDSDNKWKQGKMMEMTVVMLLGMAGLLLVNLSKN